MAIIACFLWSTAFVGVKYGLQFSTPLQFAGIRFFISGLLILPLVNMGMRNYFAYFRTNTRIVFIITMLQSFTVAIIYLGINLVPAALSAIIIGSGPFVIAIIAHFSITDDRLSWKKLWIFMLGLSGIVFVSFGKNNFTLSGEVKFTGILLLFMAVIVGGVVNVIILKDKKNVPPLLLSSSSMIIGGATLFLFSVPFEGLNFKIKPLDYYLILAWLSFLSAVAVSIWFVLLKRPGIKVSDLNFWQFIIPISGALLSWVIFSDERSNYVAIIGMGIIALAIILMNLHNRNLEKKILQGQIKSLHLLRYVKFLQSLFKQVQ